MSGLWDQRKKENLQRAEPLAMRMRPRNLDEFIGQEHLLGEGRMLRRMLQADRLTSVLFYGPPGTGKTTLARLIAEYTQRRFEQANAVSVGVKEVREILDRARMHLAQDARQTILFLDEIHRFNRAQQDVLLGDVERGVVTLIGATTENPYFAINSALVSRSQVFQFELHDQPQIISILKRAITDPERGFGKRDLQVTDEAINHWATICDGDARRALTALEIAVLSGGVTDEQADENQTIHINLEVAQESIQRKAIVYDGTGDDHYDTISAFIKSMRGSDPDAAIYWLAKMIAAGEDPRFIARRIAILASEDIGNADPRAITVAAAAYAITERIGLPECQLTLAQAVIYMATAPKSNACTVAISKALSDVKAGRTVPVPKHLRDGHYAGAKELGHAVGYQYAHNSETGYVDQEYLGVDVQYYQPTQRGYEQRIGQFLEWVANQKSSTDTVQSPDNTQVADKD
ncbi:MAG TPA: AAA family ATPase [Phycisphaerales bacterium]|nr:AAA family ATPase [Phycisphaerales bacterium]|tara:strand:+ start:165478 stop:166863 length:1386 start_codon:yes stop_codon:yes gene_type:complete